MAWFAFVGSMFILLLLLSFLSLKLVSFSKDVNELAPLKGSFSSSSNVSENSEHSLLSFSTCQVEGIQESLELFTRKESCVFGVNVSEPLLQSTVPSQIAQDSLVPVHHVGIFCLWEEVWFGLDPSDGGIIRVGDVEDVTPDADASANIKSVDRDPSVSLVLYDRSAQESATDDARVLYWRLIHLNGIIKKVVGDDELSIDVLDIRGFHGSQEVENFVLSVNLPWRFWHQRTNARS